MPKLINEYLSILDKLKGDQEGRDAALAYLQASDVDAHGEPLNFSYVPYLVDKDLHDHFKYIASTIHGILTKIIDHYLKDENYRKLFGYSKTLEDLIMLPCDYSQLLPMARFDIFMDEESQEFKFCEFNTDGTSCMSRDLILGQALTQGDAFKSFCNRHKNVENYELFDSWANACLKDYFECKNSCENPLVVIADFMDEHATFSDFNRYKEAFERCGARAKVLDITSFKYDGNHLTDEDGEVVDVIYRRAVTCDIIDKINDCKALIDAVKDNNVCLVGHFRTTVVHTKTINIMLFDETTRSFLTNEECEFIDKHCPKTFRLTSKVPIDLDEVSNNPSGWIIKPEDDYGAKGVFAGPDFSKDQWAEIITSNIDKGYVLQEYATQHTTDVMFTGRDLDNTTPVQKFNAMPGLYTYNGEFAGIYLRCGNEGVIAVDHNGLVKPAFKVDF